MHAGAPIRVMLAGMRLIGRLLPLVLAATLIAAAHGQRLVSLPIEDVVEAPIEVSEVSSVAASLVVVTSIDLACVVVFGRDASFGGLALDQDMGGGAHRDHRVVMRGLEPDTEYLYRLQGSDAQGNFYASEVRRFRTPPAARGAALGVDVATVAAGAVVIATSSDFGSGFAGERAIDGDARSEWSSRGDGDGAFITVRLSEAVDVTGFGLWTRTMGSSAQIERFEVVNEHGDVFGPFEVPDAAALHAFAASGRGQEFTFRVVASSGGNTGAVEVAVYTQRR